MILSFFCDFFNKKDVFLTIFLHLFRFLSTINEKYKKDSKNKEILAIDKDPAVGLATALGVNPTMTLEDILGVNVYEAMNRCMENIEILKLVGEDNPKYFRCNLHEKI